MKVSFRERCLIRGVLLLVLLVGIPDGCFAAYKSGVKSGGVNDDTEVKNEPFGVAYEYAKGFIDNKFDSEDAWKETCNQIIKKYREEMTGLFVQYYNEFTDSKKVLSEDRKSKLRRVFGEINIALTNYYKGLHSDLQKGTEGRLLDKLTDKLYKLSQSIAQGLGVVEIPDPKDSRKTVSVKVKDAINELSEGA